MGRAILLLGLALGVCAGLLPRGLEHDVDAGTAVRLDSIEELVDESDLVLEGRVRSLSSRLNQAGLIETEFAIEVDRTFVGQDLAERSVRLPGGVLENGNGLMLPGLPTIVVGEDVLLFLSAASANGVRMPVGLSQGKFRVETALDGSRRLSRRHGSLSLIDPNSGHIQDAGASSVFDYAAMIAEIYAAAERKASAPASGGQPK